MLTERKRGRARERHLLGWGQRRDGNHPGVWRYATPPASGGLCRPEVRRSKPSPRFLSRGDVRFRPASRGAAGLKTGVPVLARHLPCAAPSLAGFA